MMELFSLDTVLVAKNQGIDIILGENVLFELNNNVSKIRDLNIKNLAVSNAFAQGNRKLLKELHEYGIMTYIYGINNYFFGYPVIFNEKFFMTNHSFDFSFGLYADKLPY